MFPNVSKMNLTTSTTVVLPMNPPREILPKNDIQLSNGARHLLPKATHSDANNMFGGFVTLIAPLCKRY